MSVAAIVAMGVAAAVAYWLGRRVPPPQDTGVGCHLVRASRNATAMSGEYVCAAVFLGIAGAVVTDGADALWLPIGFTAGFLAMLVFVAAPLRRSGAYTVPDFVDGRLGSTGVRRLAGALTVAIALLYLVPQLHGAQVAFTVLAGGPSWLGAVILTAFVLVSVLTGGMRSMTVTQAFGYWIKLFAIMVVALVCAAFVIGGEPRPVPREWFVAGADGGLLHTYSVLVALVLGAMGLPHLLTRFYANRDGRAARRTTVHVLRLVGLFAVFPTVIGVAARLSTVDSRGEVAVLALPSALIGGAGGQVVTMIFAAGLFSAFAAAACGLVFGVAGVVSNDLLRVRFPVAAVLVAAAALALALGQPRIALVDSVTTAFALAAATFCPVLVLGIWWRGLTARGAGAGMAVGALLVLTAYVVETVATYTGWSAPSIVEDPALVAVPSAFAVMVLVSLGTADHVPDGIATSMLRMHAPDTLGFVREEGA